MNAALIDLARRTTHEQIFLLKTSLYGFLFIVLLLVLIAAPIAAGMMTASVIASFTSRHLEISFKPGDTLPAWSNLRARLDGEDVTGGTCSGGTFTFGVSNATDDLVSMTLDRGLGSGFEVSLNELSREQLGALGTFRCATGLPMPARASLALDLGDLAAANWAATLSGRVVIGALAEVGADGAAGVAGTFDRAGENLLRSGTVITEVRSLPFPSSVIRTSHVLYPGDQLSLQEPGAGPGAPGPISYLTVLPDADRFNVILRTTAREAEIARFGSDRLGPTRLAPPIWARFQAQEEWLVWLALFLVLRAALKAYETLCLSVWSKDREGAGP